MKSERELNAFFSELGEAASEAEGLNGDRHLSDEVHNLEESRPLATKIGQLATRSRVSIAELFPNRQERLILAAFGVIATAAGVETSRRHPLFR